MRYVQYCDWMHKFCPKGELHHIGDSNDPLRDAACQRRCLALPRGGAPGDASGNTLNCRLKFMAAAARSTLPEIHCAYELLCTDSGTSAGSHILGLVADEIAVRGGAHEVREEL